MALAAVVLIAVSAGCRARDSDWVKMYPQEREHTAYVLSRLAMAKELPLEQRARSIWRLWIEVRFEKGWSDSHAYADTVFDEFAACGAAGRSIVLQEIEAASDPSASEAAAAAVLFGPEIVEELLGKLTNPDHMVQFFAVSAVHRCIILDLDDETRDRIRRAVAPLLKSTHDGVRFTAEALLDDLRTESD